MSKNTLLERPPFCTTPNIHWPFPHTQPAKLYLAATSFTRAHFTQTAFATWEISPPETLLTAVNKRQAEFLAGRICAKTVLSHMGIAHHTINTDTERRPIWPSGIIGSITHTHNIAAAIVAPADKYLAIGLDYEQIVTHSSLEELSGTILTTKERAFLKTQRKNERHTYFSLVFSLKESLFKALNPITKVFFDFQAAQVMSLNHGQATLQLCIDLDATWRKGMQIKALYHHDQNRVKTLVLIAQNH